MNCAHFTKILTFTILAFTLGWGSLSSAEPAMDPDMMAKWQAYATPTENHRVLNPLVGNWNFTIRMWMTPDAEPEVSAGTSDNAWSFGGRFVEQTVHGMSMGQPFEGRQITGYNNATSQYVGIWYEDMGTGIMMSDTGRYDAAGRILTQTGMFVCPLKGQMPFRWVTKFIDDNSYIFQGYMTENGNEYLGMEIVYTRR